MNELKKALMNNKITFGTWIQIPCPSIIEIIISNFDQKLDWICIDMEHGVIDIESMTNLIRTIEKFNIVPIVRIPKNDYVWIHRVLDAGSKGIIIPMINNYNDGIFAMSEIKYPPEGKRSFGYSRGNDYGTNFDKCIKEFNDEISVIFQIEHIDAINELKEILKIPYIDATFIGPLDLAGSMGISSCDNDEINKKLKYYLKTSKDLNVPAGYHIIRPNYDIINEIKDQGYKMIAIGLDVVFLGEKCKEISNYME